MIGLGDAGLITRWLVVFVVLGVIPACSGEGSGGSSKSTEDSQQQICAIGDQLGDISTELSSPSVTELSGRDLGGIFVRRRDLYGRAARLVDDQDDQQLVRGYLQESKVADDALARIWDANRTRVESIGSVWPWVLVMSDPEVTDEERGAYFAARGDFTMVLDALGEACLGGVLPAAVEQEDPKPLPPGVLGFVTLDGVQEFALAGTDGSQVSPVGLPEGAEGVTTLDASPDGTALAVTSWVADGWQVGEFTQGSGFRNWATFPGTSVECVNWAAGGTKLLVPTMSYRGEREVLSVGESGDSSRLDLPGVWPTCVVEPEPGLLVGTYAEDVWELPAPAVLDTATGEVERLDAPEACSMIVGGVSPDHEQVAFAATCDDPLESGLYVAPLEGGKARQLVAGHVALPKWSGSGDWILFGFSSLGEPLPDSIRVWAVEPDGESLQQVLDEPSSFPVWTAFETIAAQALES